MKDGKPILIRLIDASVKLKKYLFKPEWGNYDLSCGGILHQSQEDQLIGINTRILQNTKEKGINLQTFQMITTL